ncbi:hypothetical protein CC707_17300 [Salmonella enterica subsp. enterica serovar Panama]|uniref:Uncharacterized protein n=1 Tax=Salmonella enterica subsp. enterica serovar Panama TaxID=29472 RepID=A0A636GBW8_SALET|nr:hypothetical protein [Salmonella enterica subsp. enterica serovar Panama]EDI0272856.1 hypothetical protein [Salmonella enterica subsp. enterica serovar Panama]
MPLIKLNPKRSYVFSSLVEDVRMDSLRNRLLSLFKCTGDFFKEDGFNKSRFPATYSLNRDALLSLLHDWREFRDDCRSVPFCRFRLLHRLRLQSWGETADEEIAKLSSLTANTQVLKDKSG